MLRRAGLIGDIHCQVLRLEQALGLFRDQQVDTVLSVGDIADGTGDLDITCQLLESAGVLAVAGNHDRWLLASQNRELPEATPEAAVTPRARAYLAGLPKTRTFQSARGAVLLCHGLGDDDMACVRPDDYGYALESNRSLWALVDAGTARFVINGHSHRAMLRTISGVTIVNAGTLHPKHRPMCAIADFDHGYVQIFDLNGPAVTLAERWTLDRSRPL